MNKPKRAWMVRAGNDNFLADLVEEQGAVAIGWSAMGDVSNLSSRTEFKELYWEAHPSAPAGQVPVNAGQVFNFARVIQVGDYVLTYDKASRELIIGTVVGPYQFDPSLFGEDYPHIRPVEWYQRVSRDDFSQSAKNSMGGTLTVFRLHDYIEEIHAAITEEVIEPDLIEEAEEEPPFYDDVKSKADELISDLISRLDGYQFQDLAAAVLRSMGFHANSSSPGRDRGVDIIASPDPLGLEDPRFKVQVKHRETSKVGADEMRSFVTAISNYQGLYISTGGFTTEAMMEAERSNQPISMVDRDRFVTLLLEHYHNLEPKFKAMIPLTQVWVPVEE